MDAFIKGYAKITNEDEENLRQEAFYFLPIVLLHLIANRLHGTKCALCEDIATIYRNIRPLIKYSDLE